MSREMVKRVIDQHLEEVTYCYETALMSNPSIHGRIVFEWKILMNGRVGEIRIVASNVNSHEIHNCIKSAIKSWQFPRPKGAEVVVSYPFVLDLVSF
jgi:outer membrane biosynthesis protein TonB